MKCSICFDALGPESGPVATRCGHLYCLDCATFNFGRADATCAICRTPHTLKKLVKLYPDYEPESQTAGPSADKRTATAGGRAAGSGAPAVQEVDTWDESTLVDYAFVRRVYTSALLIPGSCSFRADAAISRSSYGGEARADLRVGRLCRPSNAVLKGQQESLRALRGILRTIYAVCSNSFRTLPLLTSLRP